MFLALQILTGSPSCSLQHVDMNSSRRGQVGVTSMRMVTNRSDTLQLGQGRKRNSLLLSPEISSALQEKRSDIQNSASDYTSRKNPSWSKHPHSLTAFPKVSSPKVPLYYFSVVDSESSTYNQPPSAPRNPPRKNSPNNCNTFQSLFQATIPSLLRIHENINTPLILLLYYPLPSLFFPILHLRLQTLNPPFPLPNPSP